MIYSRICRLLLIEKGIASVGTLSSRGEKKTPPHFFRNLLFNGLGRGERERIKKTDKKPERQWMKKEKKKETSRCNDLMYLKIQ